MKPTRFFILFLLLSQLRGNSCSVYKITMYGKTFVGNNEDYWNANTRIWFEKGKAGQYGAMFVGFDNLFPQGGMNEKGLAFDGFAVRSYSLKKKLNKLAFYDHLIRDVLKKCQDVNEVYTLLDRYDMSELNGGMLLFVDKTGSYLVVEADTMLKGNDDKYVLSNFCPSRTPDPGTVKIPFYQKGKKMMDAKVDTSLSYLSALSDTLHQAWPGNTGGTLYTTIYDLNEGTVNLFFYHDYSRSVKFDLKKQLAKKDTVIAIPPMFPENKPGQAQFNNFNNAKKLMKAIDEQDLARDSVTLANYIRSQGIEAMIGYFEQDINSMGYELLKRKKITQAINVFKLNVQYFPGSWNCYDSLGDSYMAAKQYDLAATNYEISLKLNPGNQNAVEQLKKIKVMKKSS